MKKTRSSPTLTEQLEGALRDIKQGDVRALPAPPVLPPIPAFTAAEVRARRASLNMTQSEFADLLQVATKTVQAWEAGRRSPSPGQARWIELFTGQDWSDRLRKPTPHPRAPREARVNRVDATVGDSEPVGPRRKPGGRSKMASQTDETRPKHTRVASAARSRPAMISETVEED